MEKITKKEFEKSTSRRRSPISIALDELKINEGLNILKTDYNKKSPFHAYIHNLFNDKAFTIASLKSGEGWSVLRIK